MADVWVSRKKWTCKYCDVTINDDLPSRRHHESGLRHKQNKEKALKDLYRKGEQERKDAEHTRREMERIEALAAASYAKDQAGTQQSDLTTTLPSTSAQPSAGTLSSTAAAAARPKPQSTHIRRDAKQAGERKEEAPQPIAQAGEWEQVEPAQPFQYQYAASTSQTTEVSDRDRAKSFRMKEKVAPIDDSDDETDPARSVIRTKKKPRTDDSRDTNRAGSLSGASNVKREESAPASEAVKSELGDSAAATSSTRPQSAATAEDAADGVIKQEKEEELANVSTAVNEEENGGSGGGGGLFKKRRAGAGAGAKRVRAVI